MEFDVIKIAPLRNRELNYLRRWFDGDFSPWAIPQTSQESVLSILTPPTGWTFLLAFAHDQAGIRTPLLLFKNAVPPYALPELFPGPICSAIWSRVRRAVVQYNPGLGGYFDRLAEQQRMPDPTQAECYCNETS